MRKKTGIQEPAGLAISDLIVANVSIVFRNFSFERSSQFRKTQNENAPQNGPDETEVDQPDNEIEQGGEKEEEKEPEETQNRNPKALNNKTKTSKVGAISKAQKAQSF